MEGVDKYQHESKKNSNITLLTAHNIAGAAKEIDDTVTDKQHEGGLKKTNKEAGD